MVVRHHVEGYENFIQFIKKLNEEVKAPIIVLYSGSNLPNGVSWCSDCVEAEPKIEEGIAAAPKHYHFVHVQVGDRPFWKDPKCVFRTSTETRLLVLPTLVRWGTGRRLEGDQCLNLDLIQMLLSDEDD